MATSRSRSRSSSERYHPPLTTIFTPPASCNSIITYDGTTLWQNGVRQTGDASCYPPAFYQELLWNYYSPGICPEQWTSVGTLSHPSSNNAAMCCPTYVGLVPLSNHYDMADYWSLQGIFPLQYTNHRITGKLLRFPVQHSPNQRPSDLPPSL